jgi:hypothetical protein
MRKKKMKNMSFRIFTALLFGLLFSLFLSIGYVNNAYSQAYVIEDISYDPVTQIYTYTYTLKNLEKQQVWWWGIFYPEDPKAILDDSSVDKNGFAPTDLTDCSPGWKSTAPQRKGFYLYNGPNGEPGFYSTYASDFYSANQPIQPDYAISMIRLGDMYGWNGYGANIITAYGIQKGQEGYYVIQSKEYFPGNKGFFYNTRDYWNSYYDAKTGQPVIGGFEFVDTTQRSSFIQSPLSLGYNLIALPVEGFMDSTPCQASTLLITIEGCKSITRFDPLTQRNDYILSGDGQIVGTDFTIAPGEGYYIEVSADTTFSFNGVIASEPQTLNLSQGYNFISLIYGPNMPDDFRTGYTASTLLTAIPGCEKVIRYNSSSQKTESYGYFFGEPAGPVDFDILVGEGYMIEVLNDTTWTP